jgi:hypothetical protein
MVIMTEIPTARLRVAPLFSCNLTKSAMASGLRTTLSVIWAAASWERWLSIELPISTARDSSCTTVVVCA